MALTFFKCEKNEQKYYRYSSRIMCAYSLKEHLDRLLKSYKISLVQLHKNTGVPLTTLKRIKNDSSANPTLSSLAPIAEFFSITINQLVGIDPLPDDLPIGVYVEKRDRWTAVPLLTWEEAVNWPNLEYEIKVEKFVSTDIELGENAYALEVEDENWSGFLKGTKLIIDPNIKPKHKNYAVVYKRGSGTTTFKFILIHDDIVYLKPLNPDFEKSIFNEYEYVFKGILLQARTDV